MQVEELPLGGARLLRPVLHRDDRGWFCETFNQRGFAAAGLPTDFAQDNQSVSRHGVLRGLHLQVHQPQGKLVRVLDGLIFDVILDLRRQSPTMGQWAGLTLAPHSPEGQVEMLWVPEGFAHGFLVLSESATVQYKVTRPYDPGGEQTIRWDDPEIGIAWPLHLLRATGPIVSAKDASGVCLRSATLF